MDQAKGRSRAERGVPRGFRRSRAPGMKLGAPGGSRTWAAVPLMKEQGLAAAGARLARVTVRRGRSRRVARLKWRRHPDSNRGIRVLQTLALPLGYAAPKRLWGGNL